MNLLKTIHGMILLTHVTLYERRQNKRSDHGEQGAGYVS